MPLGIVPPLTTWERRNSCIVEFSDLFSDMFAAAHAFSTHGIICYMAFSLVLLLKLTYPFSKRIHGKESCFAVK